MLALERTDPASVDPATLRDLARVDILAAARALGVIARQRGFLRKEVEATRDHWIERLKEAAQRARDAGMVPAMIRECAGSYAHVVRL